MRNQKGLSLVELMIAITLGLILMTGVVQMFISSRNVFATQQGISRIQETGRLAIDFIARDARNAGYYGCFRPSDDAGVLQNNTLAVAGLHKNFDIPIMGYDSIATLPSGAATDLGVSTAITNSSILVLRGAGENGAVINTASAATNISGYTPNALSGTCIGDLCTSSVMVAADCTKARVFLASAMSLTGTQVKITHPDTWLSTDGYNKGEILPMNTTVYFVAPSASGTGNSLWQRINNGQPAELLEGVDNLHITYAVTPSTYKNANALSASNWKAVGAMRLELLIKSVDNNVVSTSQTYSYKGANVTAAASDLHMYQVFTTTIDFRNHENFH